VDVGALERQLISCTNANTVRILLVKLCGTAPGKPLWAINPSWDVPQPLKTLIMAMPVSFLQDFSYVLLGKARELATRGNYIDAVSMLSVLKSETQRQEMAANVQLMCKLLTWEILHIQITQSLEEWHQKPLDLQSHSPQRPAEQGLQLTRKQLALKILELKVATWLKWDLDALEKNLPVIMQLALLRDLCTISYGSPFSIPLPSDFDLKICELLPKPRLSFSVTP